MDNRIRVIGGLTVVALLVGVSIGSLVWRSNQADTAATGAELDFDDSASDDVDDDADDTSRADITTEGSGQGGPLEEFVDEAVTFIEDLRGAPFLERPVVVALPEHDFVARVENDLETEFAEDPELVEENTAIQRAIGFIRPDQTSDEVLREFLAAGVLGFYDPETKELVVRQVSELDLLTKSTIVHELTHAYDDQHHDLHRPELDEDGSTERGWTFVAVAEGSASHVESAWVATLSDIERVTLQAQEANFGDPGMFASFDFAYLLLQVSVYVEGEPYVDALVAQGGYEALSSEFDDLPLTSEAVMEFGSSVDVAPVAVPVPPADGEIVWEGVGGQVVLDALFAGTFTATPEAATGWGGDAMVFYTSGSESCMRWDIVMDTGIDERELVAGLEAWTAQRGGAVSTIDGRVRLERCA